MRLSTEYHDARRMLRHLLKMPGDGKVEATGYTEAETEFMKATCAHVVMLYQICFMAGFDAANAMKGVEALTVETKKMVYEICDEELPK